MTSSSVSSTVSYSDSTTCSQANLRRQRSIEALAQAHAQARAQNHAQAQAHDQAQLEAQVQAHAQVADHAHAAALARAEAYAYAQAAHQAREDACRDMLAVRHGRTPSHAGPPPPAAAQPQNLIGTNTTTNPNDDRPHQGQPSSAPQLRQSSRHQPHSLFIDNTTRIEGHHNTITLDHRSLTILQGAIHCAIGRGVNVHVNTGLYLSGSRNGVKTHWPDEIAGGQGKEEDEKVQEGERAGVGVRVGLEDGREIEKGEIGEGEKGVGSEREGREGGEGEREGREGGEGETGIGGEVERAREPAGESETPRAPAPSHDAGTKRKAGEEDIKEGAENRQTKKVAQKTRFE